MFLKLTQINTKLPVVVDVKCFGKERRSLSDYSPSGPMDTTFVGDASGACYYVEESYELIEAFVGTYLQILVPSFGEDGGLRVSSTANPRGITPTDGD